MIKQLFDLANYSFNVNSIPPAVVSIFVLLLGIYVLIQNRKEKTNIFFFFATLSCAIWLSGTSVFYLLKDPSLSIFVYKFCSFLGVSTISPGVYALTVSTLNLFEKKKKIILLNYVMGFLFYFLFFKTDWFVIGVKKYFWGNYFLYGPLSYLFLLFFITPMVLSFCYYSIELKKMEPGPKKDQTRMLFLALVIAYFGAVDFLPCFGIEIYPFGYIPIFIFISIQGYALLSYQRVRIKQILNSMQDGLIVINAENKVIIANPSAEKMLGVNSYTLLNKDIADVISLISFKLNNAEQAEKLVDMLKRNKKNVINNEEITFSEPFVCLTLNTMPIIDRFGEVSGTMLNLRDITAQKEVEIKLKESEEKYRTLIENLNVGVYRNTGGPYGKFIHVNSALIKIFGFDSIEEFMKISVSDTYQNSEERKFFIEKLTKYGFVKDEKLKMKKKDGTPIWCSLNATAKYDEKGNIKWTDGVIEDITEKKKIQEQIEKLNRSLQEKTIELQYSNEELESFSYSVSHDLRAPLRAIAGFSNILLEEYADKFDVDGRRYLNIISTNVKQMDQLINDLLTFSRTSKKDIHLSNIDMEKLAKDVFNELKISNSGRNIEFTIEKLPSVRGDPSMIHQVFFNLLSNAIKFTKNKEVAFIKVGCIIEKKENIYYVKDNGVGFDMKYKDKLFNVFQRLHSTEEFEGTGIGLAIVQRIIHRHNGRVWAEGQVNEGATFYFTIPKQDKND